MRALFLTLTFPPDNVSTGHLMADIATGLVGKGHEVVVVTSVPHYNHDGSAESSQPLRRKWGKLVQQSTLDGVDVLHVWMPHKGSKVAVRLLSWVWFHLVSTVVALVSVRRIDVVVATSTPPLTIGISAWLIGLRHGAPYVYNVQELYPDVAEALGAMKNRLAIRAAKGLERLVYRTATAVTAISEQIRAAVISTGAPAEKVHLIPNFVDLEFLTPLPKNNAFAREHGLVEKFVVSYAGNMGVPQRLDLVLDAAKLVGDNSDIVFVMAGNGAVRHLLEARIAGEEIRNVTLLPHQPYELVPQIYAASDISLVTLDSGIGSHALPSKVYRIMACGRPVLAVADPGSDLAELVGESGCGATVEGAATAIAAAVRNAYNGREALELQGAAGRGFVTENYSRQLVVDRYERLLADLVSGP